MKRTAILAICIVYILGLSTSYANPCDLDTVLYATAEEATDSEVASAAETEEGVEMGAPAAAPRQQLTETQMMYLSMLQKNRVIFVDPSVPGTEVMSSSLVDLLENMTEGNKAHKITLYFSPNEFQVQDQVLKYVIKKMLFERQLPVLEVTTVKTSRGEEIRFTTVITDSIGAVNLINLILSGPKQVEFKNGEEVIPVAVNLTQAKPLRRPVGFR